MDALLATLDLYGLGGPNALIYLGLALVVILVIVVAVLAIVLNILKRFFRNKKESDLIILSVSLPKFNPDDKDVSGQPKSHQELVERIATAEALMNSVAGLPRQRGFKAWFFGRTDYYSFEIVLKEGQIHFYVAVPHPMVQYIKEQITAQFQTAVVEELDDYNIFLNRGAIDGAELKFKREYIFPLKTYKEIETDPLSSITNTMSVLPEGTGASVQFLTRSAPASWHNWGQKAASKASQGKKLTEAIKEASGSFSLKAVFGAGAPRQKPGEPPKEYRLSQMEQEAVKKIEEKASKAGLEANIRIVVSAANQAVASMALDNLVNSFSQFNIYQYGNALVKIKPNKDRLIKNFIYREFNEKNKLILNTEEAASIFHFPLPHIETPNIAWLQSRKVAAPVGTPKAGLLLGYNEFRGTKTPIFMETPDRHRHMYVVGMTGSGKSKFMDSLAIADIKAGKGVCYIDPLGDDADLIIQNIPKERAEDVIIFDPSDYERPIGMNMLEFQTPDQKIFVINEVFNIFDKLYDLKATGGPQFEQYMKNAMYLLMEDPESGMTLLEISRVLSDEDYRAYKLSKTTTQVVKNFWEKEAQKAGGEASLANMVPYITSKLTPFIANDLMRPIISQQKSSFNFREAMDQQKIIIIKLNKGKLGDINAYLLGMILIGKILFAALSRVDIPESERKEFYLYIDEFQNFLTDSINVILSEARKYKLCLTLAHQFTGQLIQAGGNTKIKDAIFGNVGTKLAFRIGVDDAELLEKEFNPPFTRYDLLNLPARTSIIKLLSRGTNTRPFNMTMYDMKEWSHPNPELGKAITELSRQKYGKDRATIEAEINERLKKRYAVAGAAPEKEISLEDLFK